MISMFTNNTLFCECPVCGHYGEDFGETSCPTCGSEELLVELDDC